jgi:streptogramin lyase
MARHRLIPLLAAALLSVAAAAPCARSIPLPDDFAPEGIAVGDRGSFFVGSLWDGDIYRGNLHTGEGSVIVDTTGRQAVGMKVEDRHHRPDRLWVAGGATGRVFVYNARTGAEMADIRVADPGAALLNDLIVTEHAVYVTNSSKPVIYVVPLSESGGIGTPSALPVTGPAAASGTTFPGLNGIESARHDRVLIVNNTVLGGLYTVDPETGASEQIELPAGAIAKGVADGLLLRGRTLWVVENSANRLVRLRLSSDLSSGVVADVIDDDDVGGLFRVPTTVARHGDDLALVNARFDLGLPPPFGPGAPKGTDYDVVLIRR